jgi:hypothetical protein
LPISSREYDTYRDTVKVRKGQEHGQAESGRQQKEGESPASNVCTGIGTAEARQHPRRHHAGRGSKNQANRETPKGRCSVEAEATRPEGNRARGAEAHDG